MIRNVVLEVLDSNQKNRLLEEASLRPSGQESSRGSSFLQGEAELAYLTHEGLFISDALNEAQQQHVAVQDQSSVVGSRIQPTRTEAAGSESGTTETSVSSEQSFMYGTRLFTPPSLVIYRHMKKAGFLQVVMKFSDLHKYRLSCLY